MIHSVKSSLLLCSFLILNACGSVTLTPDPQSDASQPAQTLEMNLPPKDDDCCLKFSQGVCVQKKSPNCAPKQNLNVVNPKEVDPCCARKDKKGVCIPAPLKDCPPSKKLK